MMRVSHETIYQSIFVQGRGELARELARCLRSGRAQRRPRNRGETRGRICDMVMISDRPPDVEDRAGLGTGRAIASSARVEAPPWGPWWSAPPATSCCCTFPRDGRPSGSTPPCAGPWPSFPASSVELAVAALALAIAVGVPVGAASARRAHSWLDYVSLGGCLLAVSIPTFLLGFLLKYVFSVKLGWLPSVGRLDVTRDASHPTGLFVLDAIATLDGGAMVGSLRHLLLPAVSLAVTAFIAVITRASVLDVRGEDYVEVVEAGTELPDGVFTDVNLVVADAELEERVGEVADEEDHGVGDEPEAGL